MPKETPYDVRFSFRAKHYGHESQIERLRERLERELYLQLNQDVNLTVESVLQVDIVEEEGAEEVEERGQEEE